MGIKDIDSIANRFALNKLYFQGFAAMFFVMRVVVKITLMWQAPGVDKAVFS